MPTAFVLPSGRGQIPLNLPSATSVEVNKLPPSGVKGVAPNTLNGAVPKGSTYGVSNPSGGVPNAYQGVPSSPSAKINSVVTNGSIVKYGTAPQVQQSPTTSAAASGLGVVGAATTGGGTVTAGGVLVGVLALGVTALTVAAAIDAKNSQSNADKALSVYKNAEAKAKAADRARTENRQPQTSEGQINFSGGQLAGIDYLIEIDLLLGGQFFIQMGVDWIFSRIGTISPPVVSKSSTNGDNVLLLTSASGLLTETIHSDWRTIQVLDFRVRPRDGRPDESLPPTVSGGTTSPPKYPDPSYFPYGTVPVDVGKPQPPNVGLPTSGVKPFADPQPTASQPAFKEPPNVDNKKNPPLSPIGATSPSGSFPTVSAPSPSPSGFTSISANQKGASQTYPNGLTNEMYRNGSSPSPSPTVVQPTTPLYQNPTQTKPSPNPSPTDNRPLNSTPDTQKDKGFDPTSLLAIPAIGIGVGAILTGIDYLKTLNQQINAQTTPIAQQTNAKQGVCDSMQPNQCGYEGVKAATTAATNPIKDIATSNGGLLAQILTAIAGLAKLIIDNFTKLFSFLDVNAKVEAVKSTITLALTLHNALMLSQSLGTTLGTIIDNVLNVFGNTFRASDGSQISATQYLGATVQQWIINVIGTENYIKLSETFAQANRIYQTGMNILNTVQSMLDSASSVAQATGINVAKIGNALRDDGAVSPKAYTHMDESKEGNRPTTLTRFTQLATTVSDLDTKAQNLVTITSAPIQIKDSIKQSKDDIKAFNDARDANSEINKQAKQTKIDEIKALKPLTEATVGKRDDDT